MTLRMANLIGGILILIVFVGYTWATWQFFTRPIQGGNDFLTHYGAWEAYVRYGLNPYSEEAALHTQRAIYGRPALPTEDQNRMVYPFYSILIHGPFALIQDYALSRAMYMTLSQLAVLAGVLMCVSLARWRPPAWLLGVVLGWSLLYYHEARGIIIGQFAIFAFFALALTLLLLRQRQDALAGVFLVVTTIKPPLVFLIVPFLMLWGVARRRWSFVLGFFITLGILVLGSLFVLPTWLGDWFYRVTRYAEYTASQSPVWTLSGIAVALVGPVGQIVLIGSLVLSLLWSWWHTLQPGNEKFFYWTFGVTLVVSNLISPRTATTDYVLMLIPTLGLFAAMDRVPKWGRIGLIAVMLFSLIGLWWLHISTVKGDWEQAIMYLPWPLILGLIWIVGRAWLLADADRIISPALAISSQ